MILAELHVDNPGMLLVHARLSEGENCVCVCVCVCVCMCARQHENRYPYSALATKHFNSTCKKVLSSQNS